MCSRCDAIGELHVRSSRLTCARRMSSNSSRKQHSQCLAAATVTRWYSCRAAAAVKCRQAWTMSPFYNACVRATGPSGSQRRSKGDDRVARGRGVREGVCEDSTEQQNRKRVKEWKRRSFGRQRSSVDQSSSQQQTEPAKGWWWCGEVEAAAVH